MEQLSTQTMLNFNNYSIIFRYMCVSYIATDMRSEVRLFILICWVTNLWEETEINLIWPHKLSSQNSLYACMPACDHIRKSVLLGSRLLKQPQGIPIECMMKFGFFFEMFTYNQKRHVHKSYCSGLTDVFSINGSRALA